MIDERSSEPAERERRINELVLDIAAQLGLECVQSTEGILRLALTALCNRNAEQEAVERAADQQKREEYRYDED